GKPCLDALVPTTHSWFCPATAAPDVYTLSLHDALPIYRRDQGSHRVAGHGQRDRQPVPDHDCLRRRLADVAADVDRRQGRDQRADRKSTRLNSSHVKISYAVFCLKKKNEKLRKTTAGHE